jgi:hypothetical protein
MNSPWQLLAETTQNHERIHSGLSAGQDLNLTPPEYEAGVLITSYCFLIIFTQRLHSSLSSAL